MKFAADHERTPSELALQVYLLGTVDFEAALSLQRRLHFEVSGDRDKAALILCEHKPLITVGRQGSRADILFEAEELRTRRWGVRWVNRGGGCLLHVPGQLAIYPILPLDRLGLGVQEYLDRLQKVILAFLGDFAIRGVISARPAGVCVNGRLLAAVGVAVRDWVTYHGIHLNINPPLDLYRLVRTKESWEPRRESANPAEPEVMTSLERERHGPTRPALVREQFLEHFQNFFACARLSLFSDHPALNGQHQRCQNLQPIPKKTTYS